MRKTSPRWIGETTKVNNDTNTRTSRILKTRNKMHFVLHTPSLQHLAQVKIVTCLWSQPDIFTQIRQVCNGRLGNQLCRRIPEWIAIEEIVESKVKALPIPQLCKTPLLNIIESLGNEFVVWCNYHILEYGNFQPLDNLMLPDQWCWTMHGTIDHKKTAELKVKDERVDVEKRYELACRNCLEDDARELIQSIGAERRREYMNGVRHVRQRHHVDLITYFTCTLSDNWRRLRRHFKGLLSPGESIAKYLFADTLLCGNQATCEYLFNKLNRRDKKQVLVKYQKVDASLSSLVLVPACNLRYYLSLMNEEQQKLVLKTCITKVIARFLWWPFQSLIVEIAERWWSWMDESDCVDGLLHILWKTRPPFQDYDYPRLFWEWWRVSSADLKQRYLNDSEVLYDLIKTSKEEFIQLFLNEAPSHHLKELIKTKYEKISRVLTDESAISDAALMECKESAALKSSSEPEDEEKRLRSQHVGRLVDLVMEIRIKSRKKCRV